MQSSSCIFCKIISGDVPSAIVQETDLTIVIKDISPKAPTHYLVMPKKHIISMGHITENDHDSLIDMAMTVKNLGKNLSPEAYNLISNNGAQAGQSVFHLHWHFLAGKNLYEGSFKL